VDRVERIWLMGFVVAKGSMRINVPTNITAKNVKIISLISFAVFIK
jgi:hypothetical protein